MYKYPLSSTHKSCVQTWLSKKDKPLFITGQPGTGKSTLSKQLLIDYHIIHVNSDHLKYSGKLCDYIKSTLFKKDILMMCSTNHYKALLIDDLQLFVKYDKSNVKNIYDYVKTHTNTNIPIVITCDQISNKYILLLQKISYNITLNSTKQLYKSIIKKELKEVKCKKTMDTTQLNQFINTSDNLHTLKINLYGLQNIRDKVYNINNLLPIIFNSTKSINELCSLCSSEYNTISLNILENISYILRTNYLDIMYNVYESVCIGDYTESKYIDKVQDNSIILFYICVCPIIYLYENISIRKQYKFKYNSYIGKSLIQIHNQNLTCSSPIDYLYILSLIYKSNVSITQDYNISQLKEIDFDPKILEKQIKVFNYYYNKQLTKKDVIKILKINK
jgi:hypothetical protein